jgi:hypothetical protein
MRENWLIKASRRRDADSNKTVKHAPLLRILDGLQSLLMKLMVRAWTEHGVPNQDFTDCPLATWFNRCGEVCADR